MSKHFNDFIIDRLERRYQQNPQYQLESEPTLPKGEIYLMFISKNPNDAVRSSVIENTVRKICYDANQCNRFSVRIEPRASSESQTEKQSSDASKSSVEETAVSQPESTPSSGSESRSEPSAQDDCIFIMPPRPTKLEDLFSTESESTSSTSSDSYDSSDSLTFEEFCERIPIDFRTSIYAQKLIRMLPNFVMDAFGRHTWSEQYEEVPLTPTLFGPSIDEPFATLIDHVYHIICWLVESAPPIYRFRRRAVELSRSISAPTILNPH